MTKPPPDITLGNVLAETHRTVPRISSEDAALRWHATRPWLAAWLERDAGLNLSDRGQNLQPGQAFSVSDQALAHHMFINGATGTGKSRLMIHVASEQIRRGYSTVVLDPKIETIYHLLSEAKKAGISPEQVVLVTPGDLTKGIPVWNPLVTDLPVHLSAADIVSVLEKRSAASWGPRLSDILTNTLVILAAHELSVFELSAFLTDESRRRQILGQQPVRQSAEDMAAYNQAVEFFVHQYAGWTVSDRNASIAPVLNKIRGLTNTAFFQALLCGKTNTLDFSELWRWQVIVLVHLDESVLGADGTRILAGLFAHFLHRTAMRVGHQGRLPVVLAIDELGVQEDFIGSALTSILAIARSQRLRLVTACQHLAQSSPALREALLSQAAVQVNFRLGQADARLMAETLATGETDRLGHAVVRVANWNKATGLAQMTTFKHKLRDAFGRAILADAVGWKDLVWQDAIRTRHGTEGQNDLPNRLRTLAVKDGVGPLYISDPVRRQLVHLSTYIDGLASSDYWFTGPSPVELVVSFPRPKLAGRRIVGLAERRQGWTRDLMALRRQEAVVRVVSPRLGVARIKTVAVETPTGDDLKAAEAYAREALRKRGRSWADCQKELQERTAANRPSVPAQSVTVTPQPTTYTTARNGAVAVGSAHGQGSCSAEQTDVPATPSLPGAPNNGKRPLELRDAPTTCYQVAEDGSIS